MNTARSPQFLQPWMHLIATARRQGMLPDAALMRAIVRYIETFQ